MCSSFVVVQESRGDLLISTRSSAYAIAPRLAIGIYMVAVGNGKFGRLRRPRQGTVMMRRSRRGATPCPPSPFRSRRPTVVTGEEGGGCADVLCVDDSHKIIPKSTILQATCTWEFLSHPQQNVVCCVIFCHF